MALRDFIDRVIHEGDLTVVLPGGETIRAGDGSGPPVRVRITSARWAAKLAVYPSMALGEAYPEWSGTRLPAAVVQALADSPCNLAVGTKPCRLRLEPCGPLVAVSMVSRHHKSPLAPRELSAAMLYAHGRSHKDIAASLGLTPATVRTYLRTAYGALGVSNKLELMAALQTR